MPAGPCVRALSFTEVTRTGVEDPLEMQRFGVQAWHFRRKTLGHYKIPTGNNALRPNPNRDAL